METKLIRVPFEAEMAKRIQSGEIEGKIVTIDGRNARIICFDANTPNGCIIALVANSGDNEIVLNYRKDGSRIGEPLAGLMLEIPEYMTFKDGDIIAFGHTEKSLAIGIFHRSKSYKSHECYVKLDWSGGLVYDVEPLTYNNSRYATESEKQKLIDALKSSKDPKSKEYLKRFFGIEVKENKETEFKFRQLVLVRNDTSTKWLPAEFGFENGDGWVCTIGGLVYRYCIPYEGNEHLLGTK